MADKLETYRQKRDFSKTAEPAGGGPGEGDPVFVVQKHAARALHYDFRLEVDGVLPSWAVPKGPSYDPKAKRLAVHVEDHPLDYQSFEGTIPEGEYGGGEVIVWDKGTYRNITEDNGQTVPMSQAIANGHVSVWLDGDKLHGGWALTRAPRPGQRQDTWLMVKHKDEFADPTLDITSVAPASVATHRVVEDLKAGREAVDTATWVQPMLAVLAKSAPVNEGEWVYERKFDGLRAIAVRNGDAVELWSRGHQSFKERFAQIVADLAALPIDNFTLDGEIVAYEGGRTSFGLLQSPGSSAQPVFEIFDVLHLLGNDTRRLSLVDRQELLRQLLDGEERLRAVETLDGDASALLQQACAQDWEGLIAKRADSPYCSGRSSDWRKLKCSASQELVIGGFTLPQGRRRHLGALLVGYYDEEGALRYAGKVGTGFSEATLDMLDTELAGRASHNSPFVDAPKMRDVSWVWPELVGNFEFAEWTSAGRLRQPRFQGLRPDKKASEVRREQPSELS